jgi:hypothetical protein
MLLLEGLQVPLEPDRALGVVVGLADGPLLQDQVSQVHVDVAVGDVQVDRPVYELLVRQVTLTTTTWCTSSSVPTARTGTRSSAPLADFFAARIVDRFG